jgi:hypothetical protein
MNFSTAHANIKNLLNKKYILGHNPTIDFKKMKFSGFDTCEEVDYILKQQSSTYEYIRKDAKVKPYIDYDGFDTNSKNKNKYLIDNQHKLLLLCNDAKRDTLNKLITLFKSSLNTLGCNITDANILILDGSRRIKEDKKEYYKISFHITTTNSKFVFNNNIDCKNILLPTLIDEELKLYNNNDFTGGKKPRIDNSVYGNTQKFRTIYSSKYTADANNIFQPVDINDEQIEEIYVKPHKYLVQYFENDYIIIQTPTHLLPDENIKEIKTNDINTVDENIKENETPYDRTTDLKNNYSVEIQKRLIEKGIKTATVRIMNKGIYTNYEIYYNGNVDKCIYGNDHERTKHSKSVCYSNVSNGHISVRCWGALCKSKDPVSLGYVLEQSPLEINKNVIQVTEKYLTNDEKNKVNKTCKKFIKKEEYKVLCIKSGTGTGKTYLLKQYIPMYEKIIKKKYNREIRILVLSTRQSYARSICNSSLKDLNIINYLDFKEDKTTDNNKLCNINRLCVSIEGLQSLLYDRWKPYDIIIMDESESISRHIFSKTVEYSSYGAFKFLRKLTDTASKIFLLDADLSNPSLHLINNIDKNKVLMINNNYTNNEKVYYFSKDKSKFIDDIKTDLKNNLKIFVVVLSKNEADFISIELKDTLHDYNKSILPINRDSAGQIKRQLENVNIHWINYDIVITTSTTGAGVDFDPKDSDGKTYKHFDKVYGFISTGCSCPTEFLQIIDRVRNPKSYTYNILYDVKIKSINEQSFIHTYKQAERSVTEINKTQLTDHVTYSFLDEEEYINNAHIYKPRDGDYTALLHYNYLNTDLNNKPSNYLLVLKLIIEQRNHKFIIDNTNHKQQKANPTTLKELSNTLISDYKISDIDTIKGKSNNDITTDDRNILNKNRICNIYKIDETKRDHEDIVNILDFEVCNTTRPKINTILHTFITEHAFNKSNMYNNKKEYTELNDRINQNLINMFRRIINIINYDFTPIYEMSIEKIKTLEDEFTYTYSERCSISRTDLNKYKVIQTVLNKYGLNLKKTHNVLKVNKKNCKILKGYEIRPEEKVYNGVSMRINNTDYDVKLNTLCETYTKYKHLQKAPVEMKKLF